MGIVNDLLKSVLKSISDGSQGKDALYQISYGGQKTDGSHDHRTNRGVDRTPSQKAGDKKRRKG